MNLPNQLTVGRLLLTFVFVAVLSSKWHLAATVGLVLFIIAGITDYADGEIARRLKLETNFGRLMDPLVDKIMMTSAFICLVENHTISAWICVIVIAREFLITGLRLLAASKGLVLSAERLGKHKTGWQIATVIFFLLLLSIHELAGPSMNHPQLFEALETSRKFLGNTLVAVMLILTVYSGLGYFWRHRNLMELQ